MKEVECGEYLERERKKFVGMVLNCVDSHEGEDWEEETEVSDEGGH